MATSPMPVLRPMLATSGPLPVDGAGPRWAYEVKWDGVRCVVSAPGDGGVRLVTRRGNDVTAAYPELAGLGDRLRGRPAVLDGEIVVLDERGRPDFGLLQQRMGVADPRRAARLMHEYPVHLVLFDLLHLDGRSLLDASYEERRAALSGLDLDAAEWSVPGYVAGHGQEVWETTRANGLEGVVAKVLSSPYLPGVRSTDWRKTKHVVTLDVVIGGWSEGRGGIAGLPGSVLAGLDGPEGLRYVGSVGSGLSDLERRELARYFEVLARDRSPFTERVGVAAAHWVEPRLIAEVGYSGWTTAGRLRHPTWHRLRPDLTRLD
ncbi:non-homologous end-joining DNA ligase [Streptomyces sp. NPDC047117]|uniref:non-homologous end-joining DNA ligase n=1 Tax=Streptomyces sp. NPDC047117 TaxID=3155379 RepID=UPI0033F3DE6A